jgi:hypothetical protein
MTSLAYQAWVFAAGTTSFSSGNVEFALTLAEAPTLPAPRVRPMEGRVESLPWTLRAVDASGAFTAQLADSGGRLDLLNRVVQVRRAIGGGAYTVLGAARLRDVALGQDVATWDLTCEGEVALARHNIIFNTTNTTRLYPPGPDRDYGPFKAPAKGQVAARGYAQMLGVKMHLLRFYEDTTGALRWPWPMTDLAVDAIKRDLRPDAYAYRPGGNFTHTRLRVGNSTFAIAGFNTIQTTDVTPGILGSPIITHRLQPDPNQFTQALDDLLVDPNGYPECWVIVSSSTQFTVGQNYTSAFLHMFSAPPSEATPLHIGTSAGIHPMTLKRRLWNGEWSSSGQPTVRYSTAAFNDGSTGVERETMVPMRFRITGPAQLGPWVDQQLNAPTGTVDLTDSSGRLVPTRVWLPNSTSVFARSFTAATLRDPHPSFFQLGREMVTELRVTYLDEQWVTGASITPAFAAQAQRPTNAAADWIRATPSTHVARHDRVAQLGLQPLRLEVHGLHPPPQLLVQVPGLGPYNDPQANATLDSGVRAIRNEVFERFGDGPVVGQLHALSTMDDVAAGDWVKLTLATYPNAGLAARGGTRYVQILGKTPTPWGPVFDYLDAGPSLNPLSAPTVTLSVSTVNPKHVVKATIGNVSTAGGVRVQLDAALSNTTAPPSSTSPLWLRQSSTITATGTVLITGRPAGSKTWARVRAGAHLRVRSSWRPSTAGVTSSGLPAPTLGGVGSIGQRQATLAFTPGAGTYPAQVFLAASTGATLGPSHLYRTLAAGTRTVGLIPLTPNTSYLVGVRHLDPYGGASSLASTTFTTLSTSSTSGGFTCSSAGSLSILLG